MESFSYTYDVLGNVLTRADANESLTETLTYDDLNRITSATVSANIAPEKTFSYNAIGNLLSKSDVGTYTYPVAGSALPHAVSSIAGTINSTFTYDPNGNQTAGVGRSISYTSYNKPASITQGSSTLFFSHDTDHQRFMQQAPEGTTLYFDAFGVHAELFSSGASEWVDYVSGGGAMLAMRVIYGSTVTTRYFHTDNLGSIAVITDTSGNVVERDGYDAWGKRRFPNGADDPTDSLTSQTTRGFTAQEELHDVGLVHLNGRVYDPLIARMTSADPMVPDPMNGQAWNRYSYVINNPLAFTDPSGYCFLGMCGFDNAVSNFFDNIFKQIGRVLRSTPILGNLAVAGAAALCAGPQALVCAVAAAFLTTTAVSGLTSGNIGAGLRQAPSPPQPPSRSMRSGTSQTPYPEHKSGHTLRQPSAPRRTRSTSWLTPRSVAAQRKPPVNNAGLPLLQVASRRPQGPSSTPTASYSASSPTARSAAPPPSSAVARSPTAPSPARSGTCLIVQVANSVEAAR